MVLGAACLGSSLTSDNRCEPVSARLKAIQADPVLKARPPGSVLVNQRARAAERDAYKVCLGAAAATTFGTGDPMAVYAELRAAAEVAGWTLRSEGPPSAGSVVPLAGYDVVILNRSLTAPALGPGTSQAPRACQTIGSSRTPGSWTLPSEPPPPVTSERRCPGVR